MEGPIEGRTIAMGKLTIQEVAKILVEKNGLEPKDANRFATEFFAVILRHLQEDDSVKVKGLGTFKIINVEARESVSVRTGERVMIDSHSKVTFTPDMTMKELVNKPFSQFETVVLNDGVEFDDMKDDNTEEEQETVEAVDAAVVEEPQLVVDEPQPVVEEPQPVIEMSQPVIEMSQPVIEEPQPVVEKPQPAAEELIAVVEEPAATIKEPVDKESETTPLLNFEEPQKEEEPEEKKLPWSRLLLGALAVLLLMALAGFGGYEYGRGSQHPLLPDTIFVTDTVYMAEEPDSESVEDAIIADIIEEQPAEQKQPAAKEQQPAVKEQAKPEEEPLDKWSAKDERIRLGAYRIVGTKEEVTVLAGQTFYSICRAHLGPNMECYVEVYNNLPQNAQVKAGQVIKIPKLESKKKRRK